MPESTAERLKFSIHPGRIPSEFPSRSRGHGSSNLRGSSDTRDRLRRRGDPLFVLQRVVKSSASIHSPGTNPHTRSSTIRGREKNNSEAAAAAAASHTASLAGSARAYDAVFRRYGILPGEDQDHMMLRGLRGRRLLDGVRGAPPADTDALIRLLVAVSGFAEAAGGALEALDLNPVIVHPRGQGVSVADAGIVTGVARPAAAVRNP